MFILNDSDVENQNQCLGGASYFTRLSDRQSGAKPSVPYSGFETRGEVQMLDLWFSGAGCFFEGQDDVFVSPNNKVHHVLHWGQ